MTLLSLVLALMLSLAACGDNASTAKDTSGPISPAGTAESASAQPDRSASPGESAPSDLSGIAPEDILIAYFGVVAGVFLLFLAHHVLNRHWFTTLGKGNYNDRRILQTVVDVLLLADILALMWSGIRLSRYVFTFLPGLCSAATARRLHMLASYWGLVLMGFHLGLHWAAVTALLRRRVGGKAGALPWCAGVAAGLYGAYAAWRHQIWLYLTLRSEFIQFDFDRPAALYFWDHFCMMALFALFAYTIVSLARNHRKGAAEP